MAHCIRRSPVGWGRRRVSALAPRHPKTSLVNDGTVPPAQRSLRTARLGHQTEARFFSLHLANAGAAVAVSGAERPRFIRETDSSRSVATTGAVSVHPPNPARGTARPAPPNRPSHARDPDD